MRDRSDDFGRVYEEQVWRVYGYFAYRVRDRHAAEDLTQTTFERALRAWTRFDPRRSKESTWLLAIAHNLLVDHLRRSHAQDETHEWLGSEQVPGPEESSDVSGQLLTALAKLGDREREVLALRFGGDLSGPEIAALLGLSVANVQQIMSRSLRSLKRSLERPGPAIAQVGYPRRSTDPR